MRLVADCAATTLVAKALVLIMRGEKSRQTVGSFLKMDLSIALATYQLGLLSGVSGKVDMHRLVLLIDADAPGRTEAKFDGVVIGRFDNYRQVCNIGAFVYRGHGMLSEDAWLGKIRWVARRLSQ